MAEGAEYPKAIYRDGGSELIWGQPIETRAVSSADDEMEALEGGWRLHPITADESAPTKRRGRPPLKVDNGDS